MKNTVDHTVPAWRNRGPAMTVRRAHELALVLEAATRDPDYLDQDDAEAFAGGLNTLAVMQCQLLDQVFTQLQVDD